MNTLLTSARGAAALLAAAAPDPASPLPHGWIGTLAALGALLSLVLFLHAGPYTLVIFMFLAQPLLLLAVALFALQVFNNLRRERLL